MKFYYTIIGLCMFSAFTWAQGEHNHHHGNHTHQHHTTTNTKVNIQTKSLSISNASLVTQDNKSIRFYEDLVKGKTVAINFIYTSCKTACPIQGAVFSQVQEKLKKRLGKDIFLVSISIDPKIDSPKKLSKWGKKFKQRSGWTLVTGDKSKINNLLKSIDMYTAILEDHSPIILIGNDKQGQWKRVSGLSSPGQLAKIINNIADQGNNL